MASSPGCPPASTRGGTGSGSNAATTITACSRSGSDPSVPDRERVLGRPHVGPPGRHQRLAAIGKHDQQLQHAVSSHPTQHGKDPALKRMASPGHPHRGRQRLETGSVSRLRSTASTMTSSWASWLSRSRRPQIPAVDRRHAQGRLPGELHLARHLVRSAPGGWLFAGAVQHLPGQTRPVRHRATHPRPHPGTSEKAESGVLAGPCINATDSGVRATGLPPRRRCAESMLSGRAIRWIRVTAGCGMCVTPTIICSGSSDPKPRLSRSNNRSPVSCATS